MAFTIDHDWLLTSIGKATEEELVQTIEKTLWESVAPKIKEIAVKSAKTVLERAEVHIERNYAMDRVDIRYFFGDKEFKLAE